MSAGILGVIAVPRAIGCEIVSDLSLRLESSFRYYDESDHDLGGEYSESGKQIVDDLARTLVQHLGMPVLFRREWVDYWNAGFNFDNTLSNLTIAHQQFNGGQCNLSITVGSIDLDNLALAVRKHARRKVALEDKWMHAALLEAARAYEHVVPDIALILYGWVVDACIDDERIKSAERMHWNCGRFE